MAGLVFLHAAGHAIPNINKGHRMQPDTGQLISAVIEKENIHHSILFGVAGEGENTTIGELHLAECSACGTSDSATAALRHFALEAGAEGALLAMPHPVVALAYAITEPHVEWNPEDPYRYTPPGDHPEATISTTMWVYGLDYTAHAMRIGPDNAPVPLPVGAVEDDRTLTALAALAGRLKRALTPAM